MPKVCVERKALANVPPAWLCFLTALLCSAVYEHEKPPLRHAGRAHVRPWGSSSSRVNICQSFTLTKSTLCLKFNTLSSITVQTVVSDIEIYLSFHRLEKFSPFYCSMTWIQPHCKCSSLRENAMHLPHGDIGDNRWRDFHGQKSCRGKTWLAPKRPGFACDAGHFLLKTFEASWERLHC